MDFDYNHIFEENRLITNKTLLTWTSILGGVVSVFWLLGLAHVVSVYTWIFYIVAPFSILFLFTPTIVNAIFKPLDNRILTKIVLVSFLSAIFLLSISLSHYVAVAWVFPLILACQYCSRRITHTVFIIGFIGMISSYYLALLVGIWDINLSGVQSTGFVRDLSLSTFSSATIYLLPRIILYCASYPMFSSITKRSELFMKKQKLSIMACQARQTFDSISELSENFETDAKIKVRYLTKNGINVDQAIAAMDGNIEKYNDFILTFLGESSRKKNEMRALLNKDSIIQYGGKVHALRMKANALGITALTDTAFFHEIEAYAGNVELVSLNWEKLSLEWDEAVTAFTSYIKSLGLNEHATDSEGNQISFKKWG